MTDDYSGTKDGYEIYSTRRQAPSKAMSLMLNALYPRLRLQGSPLGEVLVVMPKGPVPARHSLLAKHTGTSDPPALLRLVRNLCGQARLNFIRTAQWLRKSLKASCC